MLKSYKTEIKPNENQKQKIIETIGVCRYVYNLYIEKCRKLYQEQHSFLSGYEFSKWLNNYHSTQKEYCWIKEVSSKAVKQSIMNGEKSFKNFFRKDSSYPRFKRRSDYGSFYLIGVIHVKRHQIQLPTLGKVMIKEKGYIPFHGIKSATVSKEGNRYFVSVLVEQERDVIYKNKQSEGIGIDMGIKEFLFDSNNFSIENFSKQEKLLKLGKSLKRQQRALNRKTPGSNNWSKQKSKIQNLHRKITSIKKDLKRKIVLTVVKNNPEFITIEKLNIKGMVKNKRLANSLHQIGIGYFISWLRHKCEEYNIELRQVSTFFPSSKTCSNCGFIKPMPLHLRTYNCDNCGVSIDRDLNANINLKQAKEYTVLV